MLVLTRKQQESLLIGDNIKISVVKIRGNSIQLGIEAPKDIRVMRSELIERQATDSASPLTLSLDIHAPQTKTEYSHVSHERANSLDAKPSTGAGEQPRKMNVLAAAELCNS